MAAMAEKVEGQATKRLCFFSIRLRKISRAGSVCCRPISLRMELLAVDVLR